MKLEWSVDALADLDRFELFLRNQHPHLAPMVVESVIDAARVLEEHPKLGRPIAGRDEYRQMILRCLTQLMYFNIVTMAPDL